MSTYLVTGATGFLGSCIVNYLLYNKLKDDKKSTVYILARNEKKAREMFGDEVEYIIADLTENIDWHNIFSDEGKPEYVIHCAAVTDSQSMIKHSVEVADGIVMGIKNVLELCKIYKENIKSVVFLSSMEVYGKVVCNGSFQGENELGELDICSERSCYPMGKRMAEHYCYLYQKQYNVPVKVARLAQVFGNGVRLDDNRVFMQLARCALEGKDIVLKTAGDSYGNYCSTEDAIAAIDLILEKGVDGETYNVVNEENTMTIKDMAELVKSRIAKFPIRVIVQQEELKNTGYASKTELKMSARKLRELGWKPSKTLEQMYQDIIQTLCKN